MYFLFCSFDKIMLFLSNFRDVCVFRLESKHNFLAVVSFKNIYVGPNHLFSRSLGLSASILKNLYF